ncbi:MAG: hypothetical protein VKN83_04300 [Cyanobacteriota bacterium]|nr:hypothetical protein [Cyanobacteriota bacterium]
MACPSCGSWAVKADRGLAGRMVCARCGSPLGIAGRQSSSRRAARRWAWVSPRRWRLWWALLALVAISAALAAQAPRPGPLLEPARPPGQGWPSGAGGLGM